MISGDKIKQFQKMLRRGVPDGEIRESMLRDGYTKEDIEEVFKPHHYDMRAWYLVFAILLLLYGIYLFIAFQIWLIMAFSGLLFLQYFREVKRLKTREKTD